MEDFEKLLEDFEPTLIKLSKAFVIPHLTSEDIAQELRLHLFLKLKNYDSGRSFCDWAYIVCKTQLKKIYRNETRKKRWAGQCDACLDDLLEQGLDIENKRDI